MIENDNIKDLFSKGLENHTTPVRPEVWNGLQAKMAAAGVASSATAVKGLSALAKWIIGGAATSAAVVTTVVIVNSQDPAPQEQKTLASATTQQPAFSSTETVNSETQQDQTSAPVTNGSTQPVQPQEQLPDNVYSKPVPTPLDFGPWQLDPQETTTGPDRNAPDPAKTNPTETTPKQIHDQEELEKALAQQKDLELQTPATVNESKITKIPNFFSPNNDGDNDEFYIESQHLNDFSVSFMDAQGNALWTSTDPNFKWDGTNRSGEPVAAGRYICLIVAKDSKGELIKEYKFIEIRR